MNATHAGRLPSQDAGWRGARSWTHGRKLRDPNGNTVGLMEFREHDNLGSIGIEI